MKVGPLRFGAPPPRSAGQPQRQVWQRIPSGFGADQQRLGEMTRGAAHRRQVRSAAAMTNRHSDPKNTNQETER